MIFSPHFRSFALFALCALLAACASQPSSNGRGGGSYTSSSENGGGVYKVGQPYQIGDQTYYPQEDYSYDETGIASWYGDDFHEQRTANGEIFNKNELTAAHRTLPMPSLARVTNLDNGRSIVVRINDRGPFAKNRIMDVSQRAAQLLGFEGAGTAKVRVQVLADESKAIADAMRHYGGGAAGTTQMAENAPPAQATEQPVALANAASLATAPVQSETLSPVRTTPEIHQQLIATKPLPEVVQLPVTGNNHLFVQAGAFTVADNATRMQQNLSKFGAASVSSITINGTKFYRVRVAVSDVAQGDALVAKLRSSKITARTVVD